MRTTETAADRLVRAHRNRRASATVRHFDAVTRVRLLARNTVQEYEIEPHLAAEHVATLRGSFRVIETWEPEV